MRRAERKPMAQINVVPYIDVMLVLLVIFMVTAPMLTQGVQVDLPQVANDPMAVDEELEPLIVSIDAQGQYFLELGQEEPQSIVLEELAPFVTNVLETTPNTAVLVRGDRSIAYGHVIELMSLLQAAGAPSVGLVTEPL
jgi:biopolymer transport protein TolR